MRTTIAILSLLSFGACLDEDTVRDLDLELGEVESAVSWTGLSGFHRTQTTNDPTCTFRECTKDLGPATDRTCFLAGVKGSLAEGSSLYPAGVLVNVVGSRWKLHMLNPFGSGIGARTVCINNTANRIVAKAWQSTSPVSTIAATTGSKRRCFLAGVYNYNDDTAFSTFNTDVNIRLNDNGTHSMTGTFPSGSNVRVFTTCVDVGVDLVFGEVLNGNSSSYSNTLVENDGGVACGLTGLLGYVGTMSQGADVTYASPNWTWWMSAYGGARVRCFK